MQCINYVVRQHFFITRVLILLIFGFSCSTKNTGQEKVSDSVDEFWSWFRENEKNLRNFESDPDKYLNQILIQAKKIEEGIAIELEAPNDGIIQMTISADGDYTLFPIVKRISEKAPELKGWKFHAFRKRESIDKVKELTLSKDGRELSVREIKFYPIAEGDSLDVIIFVRGLTEANENEIAYGGLLLLDNILGEYDCVTKVRHYDFQPMPEDQSEEEGLRPLYEIAEYVDKFKANK